MKIFDAFAKRSPNRVFVAIVLGSLAGMAYALIIPLVLAVLNPDGSRFDAVGKVSTTFLGWEVSDYRFAAAFAGVCGFILLARTLSQVILLRVSLDIATDLRTGIYERIAAAPIAALDRVGLPRLIATVTADVPMIVAGARLLPEILTSGVTMVGMLGFLLYLNPAVFWFVLGSIAVGAITYQLPVWFGRRQLIRARRHTDDLYESIRGLVHGAKELKLSRAKRADYFENVLRINEVNVRGAAKAGNTVLAVAQNYGNLITFFVIGAVSFVFVNYHAITLQQLSGVIMVLLYVAGPVNVLLNFIPQFTAAQVALRKIEETFARVPSEQIDESAADRRGWRAMHFEGVGYQYGDRQGEPGFTVGPLDLTIRKGEVTFIVGGNGSGKSTLSKLITLHHQPTLGKVLLDGEEVGPGNIAGYRAGITAIYSDYHLFDRILGVDGDLQARVDEYLVALDLDRKVAFVDGRFTTLALSDGQKRRLALLVAWLEDADLYLFDEWAADQDPTFKAVFYAQILPDLRQRGKAVVAISHDDRFFHVADHIIEMADGRIASDRRPAASGRFVDEIVGRATVPG
ncbi:MAG: cyclic peptide export ABC transporter [Rhodanobacter sp.]